MTDKLVELIGENGAKTIRKLDTRLVMDLADFRGTLIVDMNVICQLLPKSHKQQLVDSGYATLQAPKSPRWMPSSRTRAVDRERFKLKPNITELVEMSYMVMNALRPKPSVGNVQHFITRTR